MESDILECALAAVSSGLSDLDDVIDYCLEHSELSRVEEEGVFLDDYLTLILEESGRATVTADFQVVRLDELAHGLVFTHRLTAEEISSNRAVMSPDLASLNVGTIDLSSAGLPVSMDLRPDDATQEVGWVGPAGWLAGFAPGDLVGFRRSGDEVIVELVDEVGEGAAEASALRAAFDTVVGDKEGVGEEAWILLETALIDDPQLFRSPVRPISELLAGVGLESDDQYIGPKDQPWTRTGVMAGENFRDMLGGEYELEECCEEALDVAIEAFRAHTHGGHPNPRDVNRALGHGRVWEAFGDWLEEYDDLGGSMVEEFLARLVTAGHRHIAPTRLLLARHHEAAGRALEAEAAIEQAVSDDPDYGPALGELARYASDRGDAPRVVSLLRRIGMEDDHPWLSFHASLGTQWPDVGRNAPCPCGSGRKYKQCHLGRTDVSPKERVTWLLTKLGMFTTLPVRRHRIVGLAAAAMWDDFEISDMAQMMDDTFIMELAVFERGAIGEFLDERRPLLPEDELDVLVEWMDTRMSLWDVVATDGEVNVTLLDVRTGQSVEVDDRTAASTVKPGDQLLARVLPGWGGHWLSAAVVPILPQHRHSLLEVLDEYYDGDNLAAWYGALQAPPRLNNREGETIVVCNTTLRPTTTWDELEQFLDEAYERDEDAEVWRDTWELDEDERILRAVMRRDEDRLTVETNSDERMDRVLEVLSEVAEVVDESRQPAGTVNKMRALFGDSPREGETVPELSDGVLAEIRDRMEVRWLDENIPALDGLTPREAAADPTRRQDLINLLRSFDQMEIDPKSGMRPAVLRAALGLEE